MFAPFLGRRFALLACLALAACGSGSPGGGGPGGDADNQTDTDTTTDNGPTDNGPTDQDGDSGDTPRAPTFTSHPQNRSVAQGATAAFTVEVDALPPASIAWETSADGGTTWNPVASATDLTFTTAPTTLADSGHQVRAVATNDVGSVNSNAATLTVTLQPVVGNIVAGPTPQILDELGGVSIILPATTGVLTARAVTPAGRIILTESTDAPERPIILSMLPDGTGRVVLFDPATAGADVRTCGLVAVGADDTVYYRVQRTDDYYVWLYSVKSDGTDAVTSGKQLTGGTTGADNVSFFNNSPFNTNPDHRRTAYRIPNNSSYLTYETIGATAGAYSISPNIDDGHTVFLQTGNFEALCGITPDNFAIFTKRRYADVFDVWRVSLLGGTPVRLNPETVNDIHSCLVTPRGQVIVRTVSTGASDLYTAWPAWNAFATTSGFEVFNLEGPNGELIYSVQDFNTATASIRVFQPGVGDLQLSGVDDPAGAYGTPLAVTPAGRVLFVRSTINGGPQTLHSVAATTGTSRLDHLAAGKLLGDALGITATGRLIYRGGDAFDSSRLFSMRTDVVVSPSVPDQIEIGGPGHVIVLLLD